MKMKVATLNVYTWEKIWKYKYKQVDLNEDLKCVLFKMDQFTIFGDKKIVSVYDKNREIKMLPQKKIIIYSRQMTQSEDFE